MGGFVQIIEYETDKPEEMKALRNEMRDDMGDTAASFGRLVVTQDRDNPRRYLIIVEFPSYEEAMENSGRAETDAFAGRMAALCTRGPIYYNLDVQRTVP